MEEEYNVEKSFQMVIMKAKYGCIHRLKVGAGTILPQRRHKSLPYYRSLQKAC